MHFHNIFPALDYFRYSVVVARQKVIRGMGEAEGEDEECWLAGIMECDNLQIDAETLKVSRDLQAEYFIDPSVPFSGVSPNYDR